MAKRRPVFTLAEMEKELGYKIEPLTRSNVAAKRFFSDLSPVSDGVYERTKREYEYLKYSKGLERMGCDILPDLGESKTVETGEGTITLTRTSCVGQYSFSVGVYYKFGFNLPLLFTEAEASRTMLVAKLQPRTPPNITSPFFHLPRELRDKIYAFAFPRGYWNIKDIDQFDRDGFPRGIGDPSGFYFPLSKDVGILRASRQMRQEALPFAYRTTTFHLDDMDDLTKLLVAVGRIGRDNIESLQFPWESRTDSACKWDEFPDSEDNYLKLPSLHVSGCVQLLQQCKRLKHLRLHFESELMLNIPPADFMADPGIQGLCSIRSIRRLQLRGLGDEPLEQCYLAKWLKETMACPTEEEELEDEMAQECKDEKVNKPKDVMEQAEV